MLKISIPQPCHEDWDAMTATQQGRHCTACAKTVVDFTLMPDEAIKYFFLHQQEKTTCGRFTNQQLQRITISLPANIFQIYLPLWKRFLTACLLAFSSMLFSCNAVIDQQSHQTTGEPVVQQNPEPVGGKVVFGGIHFGIDSIQQQPPVCSNTVEVITMCETYTQGVSVIESVPPTEESIYTVPLPDSSGNNSILNPGIDSTQIKNPPAADSINCNAMKYY